MKLLWIALPIAVLVVAVAVRALLGRPVARQTLNVVVALYLLGYVLATAGLGLFWVARMDLPAFDVHYLFGYCLLLLAAWHFSFQVPVLSAFCRRISPRALLAADGRHWRRGVRVGFWLIVGAALAAAAASLAVEFVRPKPVIISPLPKKWNPHPPAEAQPDRVWLQRGRRKLAAADYLHEQSSLTRWGLLRSRPFVGARPDQFKAWPGHPWLELPPARRRAGVSLHEALRRRAGAPPAPPAKLARQELADLLFYANGVTDVRHYPGDVLALRAAPSAGALYPTELYVLANSVEGLAPGLYYYHAARHALAAVADGEQTREAVARAGAHSELVRTAPATILLSAVFDRTVWKYGARSYRYVTLDTGHVAGNLTLAAAALSWPCALSGHFDDERLTRALGAEPAEEGALLMAMLAQPAAGAVPAHAPPPLPRDATRMELTRLSHRLTSWQWTDGGPLTPAPHKPGGEPGPPGDAGNLPEGAAAEAELFEVIRARRSFREFADRAVPAADCAGLLRDAFRTVAAQAGGEWLRLYVLVRAVDGLEPGAYRYRPEAHALELVARGNFAGRIYNAGLWQELLARAAFVLVWTIDMERVGQRHGERDYRSACLVAGLGGENAYLSAVARGLGICGVGAFFDAAVDELLKLGGTPHRSLYLMAVGARS